MSQRKTVRSLRAEKADRMFSKKILIDGNSACAFPVADIDLKAASKMSIEKEASAQNPARHPKPRVINPPSKSGPRNTPSEPAEVQRAIFCSWRVSSVSISAPCASGTNAPDEGLNKIKASINQAKIWLVAVRII